MAAHSFHCGFPTSSCNRCIMQMFFLVPHFVAQKEGAVMSHLIIPPEHILLIGGFSQADWVLTQQHFFNVIMMQLEI